MSKIKEAEERLAEADKYMKTSLFKWKPDYDSAGLEYQRAATCFKAAKQMEKSLECNLKAAEVFLKSGQAFAAAKEYEQAAVICKDLNQLDKAVGLIERACALFREHGVADTAALTMDRGAKMLEAKVPEKAAEFWLVAGDVSMIENRPHQAAEYCGKAARMFVKLKKYSQATDALNKQMLHFQEAENDRCCGRIIVQLVLLQLVCEDIVGAQKAFQNGKCYVDPEEIYTITELLQGFDDSNPQQIRRALNNPFIKNLDNEFSKLARTIQEKHGTTASSDQPAGESQSNEEESGALL